MSRRPAPLFPGVARSTLAHRLAKRVDSIRQIPTRFGLRNDRVWLVWTRYDGEYRGEGDEVEVARLEILPTPRVSDQTSIQFAPYAAGVLPNGSVRVDRISAQLTEDILKGHRIPDEATPPGAPILHATDFFWEIVQDDRGELPPAGCGDEDHRLTVLRGQSVVPRARYRLVSEPERRPGQIDFTCALERISEDHRYDGVSRHGVVDVYEDC
jgi:hypothetical protein